MMKKLAVLLLAFTLLLTGCVSTGSSVDPHAHFGVSVSDATAELKEEAAALSFNVFETEPEVTELKEGPYYAYTVADGVLLVVYATRENMLNSIFLKADSEVCTEEGYALMQDYCELLIAHFTPEEDLESVTRQLSTYDKIGSLNSSSVTTKNVTISMMYDESATYLSVAPAAE